MCLSGCGVNSTLTLPEVLAHPYDYIDQCSPFTSPLIQPQLAEAHCRDINVTDDFFDACVFDQITSAVKMANLVETIEHDLLHLLGRRIYGNGRQSLLQYSRLQKIDYNCDPVVKSSSNIRLSSILLIIITLFFN